MFIGHPMPIEPLIPNHLTTSIEIFLKMRFYKNCLKLLFLCLMAVFVSMVIMTIPHKSYAQSQIISAEILGQDIVNLYQSAAPNTVRASLKFNNYQQIIENMDNIISQYRRSPEAHAIESGDDLYNIEGLNRENILYLLALAERENNTSTCLEHPVGSCLEALALDFGGYISEFPIDLYELTIEDLQYRDQILIEIVNALAHAQRGSEAIELLNSSLENPEITPHDIGLVLQETAVELANIGQDEIVFDHITDYMSNNNNMNNLSLSSSAFFHSAIALSYINKTEWAEQSLQRAMQYAELYKENTGESVISIDSYNWARYMIIKSHIANSNIETALNMAENLDDELYQSSAYALIANSYVEEAQIFEQESEEYRDLLRLAFDMSDRIDISDDAIERYLETIEIGEEFYHRRDALLDMAIPLVRLNQTIQINKMMREIMEIGSDMPRADEMKHFIDIIPYFNRIGLRYPYIIQKILPNINEIIREEVSIDLVLTERYIMEIMTMMGRQPAVTRVEDSLKEDIGDIYLNTMERSHAWAVLATYYIR